MTYNKAQIKPILITNELCKLLHIPHKAHYKCFIRKKYMKLSYKDRNRAINYIYDYLEKNTNERFYRWYTISQQTLIFYINKYFLDNNNLKNKIGCTYEEALNYSDDQIYIRFQSNDDKNPKTFYIS